ncbi:MAG: hypothetical protein FIA95_13285 [Gemmatimonadetes bacterium]|nr:hypothetical protein [Gemmatimonadota bacterium]
MPALDLEYDSDPSDRRLSRPFETDPTAFPSLPESERKAFEARELLKGRWYAQARSLFGEVLVSQPWSRNALLGMSELDYRSGLHDAGLERAQRALQLDAYDAQANFLAGLHHRALGHVADARDAFGWAARSTEYRAVAYTMLAEIAVGARRWDEAARYARLALDHDRNSVPAWRALAVAGRRGGDATTTAEAVAELWRLDPLGHAALAEEHLARLTPASAQALAEALSGEYPDQTLLELALAYADLGLTQDALTLLAFPTGRPPGAEAQAWRAWLRRDPALLLDAGSPAFQFPYRRESLAVLKWADEQSDAWIWTYLRALNLWAVDRADEAAGLMVSLGNAPDYAPAYASRGLLLKTARGTDAVPDLRRAVEIAPESRVLHVALAQELHAQGRWDVSLEALATARRRFPGDFNLALLEVRALLEVGRAAEAARILDGLRVLPSENARESHKLFEWAHTLLGLDALERGDAAGAREHLATALTWPESLGQGRPYEPEERLVRFLLGVAERSLGNAAAAREHFETVAAASRIPTGPRSPDPAEGVALRLVLLAIPALRALGRPADAGPLRTAPPSLFQDLEGRILRRALNLGDAR